jgi:N-glycosylase/DNA lyase
MRPLCGQDFLTTWQLGFKEKSPERKRERRKERWVEIPRDSRITHGHFQSILWVIAVIKHRPFSFKERQSKHHLSMEELVPP